MSKNVNKSVKRNSVVACRVTAEQKAMLETLASAKGITVSKLLSIEVARIVRGVFVCSTD